jgi:hypothetical protein
MDTDFFFCRPVLITSDTQPALSDTWDFSGVNRQDRESEGSLPDNAEVKTV